MRRVAAGLASLGLIGGVGAVTYDDNGSAKVTIDDGGTKRTVVLATEAGGKAYRCPASARDKLATIDEQSGRIQLTLQDVRRDRKTLEDAYPGRAAPPKGVMSDYKLLVKRDDRLVEAFNRSTDAHNAVLDSECSQ